MICRHSTVLDVPQSLPVKALKSSDVTRILRSLHCLKITERIEYNLLSLTYKVLSTTRSPYLHKLMSVQPPRSTRSSSLTLARPTTSSSLRITDHSFPCASPCLWNQLYFSPSTGLTSCRSVSLSTTHLLFDSKSTAFTFFIY